MKCTVFRVNVPLCFFFTSVLGKVDRMLAGLEVAYSGYVRKYYYDVKNRAFFLNFIRDFGHFYAHFVFINHSKYIRCENRAFSMKTMRVFPLNV